MPFWIICLDRGLDLWILNTEVPEFLFVVENTHFLLFNNICMWHMGFLAWNFGSQRREKLIKFNPNLGDLAENLMVGKLSSVLRPNGGLLGTVEWGGAKDCAVHGAYASCIICLRRWNSTTLHLIFWGNNCTSTSQHSYFLYIERNLNIVFSPMSSSLQHLVKIVTILV